MNVPNHQQPTYSICVCNYNMADTIEEALRSVLDQLKNDRKFEVVVVDDGSSDNSIKIVKNLIAEYPILRLVELERDPKRRLGITRNISIQEARGEYVLPQVDTDDVYGPYIHDFIKIFHQLEKLVNKPFYFKGGKLNIGRRDFLLELGPYRNIFHLEDRDMWARLAAIDAYIKLDHKSLYIRLPKTLKQRSSRAIYHTWEHMQVEFRYNPSLMEYFRSEKRKLKKRSLKQVGLRMLLLLPTWITAIFQGRIELPLHMNSGRKFAVYREKNRGHFAALMKRYGGEADCSELSEEGKEIFC